jgi:hypothetical protein
MNKDEIIAMMRGVRTRLSVEGKNFKDDKISQAEMAKVVGECAEMLAGLCHKMI